MFLHARVAACLAILTGGILWAQIPTGTITGSIRDSSGAALAAAVVMVRSAATNSTREVTSDSSGAFKASNLPPGTYDFTVSKPGFRTLHQPGVAVEVDRTTLVDLILDLGPVSDSVDVASKATPDDTQGVLDELFTIAELMEFVQDTRTVTDLAYLASGVARRASGGLGSGFVIGGARADNTNFIIDGFSDYDPRTGGAQVIPNYDAIEEFRIQTTGNTAEYGRMAGGVLNMVLRSGANALHGGLFEYFRSDRFSARNFFDVEKSPLLSNQYGATVGGPVVVPHVYAGKDRTFFLLSWEALRQSIGSNRLSEVPTALERSGDFSHSFDSTGRPVVVTDPLSGTAFPGDRIPVSRLDPVAQRVSTYFPLPNSPNPTDNYHADSLGQTHWNSLLLKLDEHLTEKDALSFRFLTRLNAATSPYSGSDTGLFGSRSNTRPTLAGANYTRVIGPKLVNEFRFGFTRMSDHESSNYAGLDLASPLGLPPSSAAPQFLGFPRFTVLNLASLGDSASLPLNFTVNNYELADSLSFVHGKHLLKFGGEVLRTQFFQQLNSNTNGTYNFLGRWSTVPFADFLLGLPDSTSRQLSSNPAYLFSTDAGLFVQDQYTVSSRLTLNFGLRYEMMSPPYEKYGRMSSFVPEVGMVVVSDASGVPNLAQSVAAAGLTGHVITAGQAGLPKSLMYANDRDFAPRFGFAWRPTRKSDLVIRGGYGIYFADSLLNPIRNDLTNVYPFAVSQSFNRVSGQPQALTLEDPFPAKLATLPGVTNANGFELHPQPQYLQSYSVSVERALDPATVIEVEYAGSRGTHLEREYDLNQPFRTPAYRLPNGTFLRPYPSFATINFYSFGANSVYNSGSVTLRRTFRSGIFYGVTYVYSKSIDDASQVSGNSTGDYPGAQNSRDLAAERARSDWDTGHSLVIFGSYALPFRGGRLVRGWQISTTARLYTGQPFTPRVANANLNLGEANRPDRIASGKLSDPTISDWFDLSAFPVVPAGAFRFGDSGRNILDGPGSATVNAAISKNIHLRDAASAQLRCEAINIFNRANFGLPVNYVDAQNAGQILTADPGRTLQFALRLHF
ncbi:MAG TPA: TonB-dependent receptor [Bryobacteraceae bacterium]|nr:TonB-dependent receptor [Bryobacteraceae bacterium]